MEANRCEARSSVPDPERPRDVLRLESGAVRPCEHQLAPASESSGQALLGLSPAMVHKGFGGLHVERHGALPLGRLRVRALNVVVDPDAATPDSDPPR